MTTALVEIDQIIRIAGRANRIAKQCKSKCPAVMDLAISLSVCNAHRALRLQELEQFDDFNLAHDVFGVHRHSDSTGRPVHPALRVWRECEQENRTLAKGIAALGGD